MRNRARSKVESLVHEDVKVCGSGQCLAMVIGKAVEKQNNNLQEAREAFKKSKKKSRVNKEEVQEVKKKQSSRRRARFDFSFQSMVIHLSPEVTLEG